MIPILFERNETAFTSNGLGRLRDMVECTVVEERNSIYECDFSYPVNGARYEDIQYGRIIGVTHDDTGDIQPFEIVGSTRPINGIVSFHCVHISYKQSQMVVSGNNINSLADAFNLFSTATPSNPFTYETDKTSTGFLASADGTPRSVRQMLGGIQGSVLDAYGGEYEWDKWNVILHSARGEIKDFAIRYGVNLLDYKDDTNYQNTYNSCIPFWKGAGEEETIVIGNKVSIAEEGYNGNDICVPLDLSDKFESAPSTADLESMARSYMETNDTNLPAQSIEVDFVRLADMGEFSAFQDLLECSLCDTIKVIFPMYGVETHFKIVKTEWDVLGGKFKSMELGKLSTTLAEALGISTGLDSQKWPSYIDGDFRVTGALRTSDVYIDGNQIGDFVVETGTDGIWTWEKRNSGIAECWGYVTRTNIAMTTNYGSMYYGALQTQAFPTGLFISAPTMVNVKAYDNRYGTYASIQTWTKDQVTFYPYTPKSATINTGFIFNIKGRWK